MNLLRKLRSLTEGTRLSGLPVTQTDFLIVAAFYEPIMLVVEPGYAAGVLTPGIFSRFLSKLRKDLILTAYISTAPFPTNEASILIERRLIEEI